jgi:hypothetical protein
MEIEFNESNTSDYDSEHENCPYCDESFTEESWCEECDPCRIMEGWTSGNPKIDKLIKDTIRKPEWNYTYKYKSNSEFLEWYKNSHEFLKWVTFDRFKDMKEIGEGGFSKVFSATWIDGKPSYEKSTRRVTSKSKPIKVALRRLNGSQNITEKYLNEVRLHTIVSYYFYC